MDGTHAAREAAPASAADDLWEMRRTRKLFARCWPASFSCATTSGSRNGFNISTRTASSSTWITASEAGLRSSRTYPPFSPATAGSACVNSLIEVDDDKALVTSDLIKLGLVEESGAPVWRIVVVDRFERRFGEWGIAEHRVVIEG